MGSEPKLKSALMFDHLLKCVMTVRRRLTAGTLLRIREHYYSLNQNDQTEYLINALREDFDSLSNQVRYSISVDGNKKEFLCQNAWKRVYGISNDKVQTVKDQMLEGVLRVIHGNTGVT